MRDTTSPTKTATARLATASFAAAAHLREPSLAVLARAAEHPQPMGIVAAAAALVAASQENP